ncbi:MAG: T9SS type A sorting domain-containing protein [Flavobacteriales bacterium]|nr:T9SS type A sorting domain-containing protein [Flavobacteriales bacterium]
MNPADLTCFYEDGDLVDDNPNTSFSCPSTYNAVEESIDPAFFVYPNPFHSTLKIALPLGSAGLGISAENALGQNVFTSVAETGEMQIDVSSWPGGIYLLRIGQQTTRLLKE